MVMQDHFSKYVVAHVVKDQTARTAAETLRNGYFGLFGAPAYLVSNQGPLPSLVTQQEGDMTSRVWLNGEFCTKPWTQTKSKAPESPPDQIENEVSDIKSGLSDSESEGM